MSETTFQVYLRSCGQQRPSSASYWVGKLRVDEETRHLFTLGECYGGRVHSLSSSALLGVGCYGGMRVYLSSEFKKNCWRKCSLPIITVWPTSKGHAPHRL
ncbi:hypothetical protein AVEN_91746-1 [Araneus ventricosus]|uniref:Uncharacterized protein n=1 Tax=Araneus ventricosus TaxID=182803 RepID=A0A4Y2FFJ3_ARAVE|nr:hypothetical protein AVEN_91746-1 [Araneus ventricosus]